MTSPKQRPVKVTVKDFFCVMKFASFLLLLVSKIHQLLGNVLSLRFLHRSFVEKFAIWKYYGTMVANSLGRLITLCVRFHWGYLGLSSTDLIREISLLLFTGNLKVKLSIRLMWKHYVYINSSSAFKMSSLHRTKMNVNSLCFNSSVCQRDRPLFSKAR